MPKYKSVLSKNKMKEHYFQESIIRFDKPLEVPSSDLSG